MQITQLRDSNTGQITPFRPRAVNLFFRSSSSPVPLRFAWKTNLLDRRFSLRKGREEGIGVFGQFGDGELIVIQEKLYGVK